MKKKSVLVFLLAMASATAIGAAGCSKHKHDWTLNHNADLHWYECECGVSKDAAVHVDEINNETSEAGADGKCDVCGEEVVKSSSSHVHSFTIDSDEDKHWKSCDCGEVLTDGHIDLVNNTTGETGKDGKCDVCNLQMKETVTFIMLGNGTAPDPQKVNYGGYATEPAKPKAQGYVFMGWFEDDGLKTEFNFEEKAITESTFIYAKWDEDTTPGINEKYAKEINLASEAETLSFGENSKLFFKYTALEDGRYELYLQAGVSANCSFTTNYDDDGSTYTGTAKRYFDLKQNDTVMIEVTRGENTTDTQKIGVYITATENEPLPESWTDGLYTDGNYFVTIDKAANNGRGDVKFRESGNDEASVSFNYIGGATNTLSFSSNKKSYAMTALENGSYSLMNVVENTQGEAEKKYRVIGILKYADTDNPLPVSAFAGIYQATGSGEAIGFSEIGIYENGNGYTRTGTTPRTNYVIGTNGTLYFSVANILIYDRYSITLNFNGDNEVEGVTVTLVNDGKMYKRVYEKVSEAPDATPEKLPLDPGVYYAGHSNYIYENSTSHYQYFNSDSYLANLDGYVKATNTYTMVNKSVTYQLKVQGSVEEDNLVLFLYDATGETLLDTLTKYAPAATDLLPNTTEDSTVTLALEDFQMGKHWFAVQEAGWYKFTSSQHENIQVYSNLNKDNSDDLEKENANNLVNLSENGNAVFLKAGTAICVKISGTPTESYSFTVKNVGEEGAPEGLIESTAITLDVLNKGVTQVAVQSEVVNYFKFSGAAGKYLICIAFESDLDSRLDVTYEVGDKKHDAENDKTVKYVSFEITDANTPVLIKVSPDRANIYVLVEEDYSDGTLLTFDSENNGTGEFSVSGAYRYEGINNEFPVSDGLVIGDDEGDEFTIVIGGEEKKVKKITLSDAQLVHGFKIVLDENQTVAYKVNFLDGAEQNPFKIDKGVGKLDFDFSRKQDTLKYIDYTAPVNENCTITVDSKSFYFEINGVKYGYDTKGNKLPAGTVYYINAGEKIIIKIGVDAKENTFADKVSLLIGYNFEGAEELEMFAGVPTEDKARASYAVVGVDADEGKLFTVLTTNGSDISVSAYAPFSLVDKDAVEYKVTGSKGIYTATIPAGDEICFRVYSKTAQNITFVIPYMLGSYGNPYEVDVTKKAYVSEIIPDNTTAYFKLEAGSYIADKNVISTEKSGVIPANTVFSIAEGELIRLDAIYPAGTVTISPRIPVDYIGKYNYGNGLQFDEKSVTIAETTYNIVSVNNGVYKFTYVENKIEKSVSLTLKTVEDLPVCTYDGNNYEFIYVFTEDMEQTYTGETSGYAGEYDITLTLKRNGQGTFTAINKETSEKYIDTSIIASENNGKYTFSYMRGTTLNSATFKFGANGVISIDYSEYLTDNELTPETPFEYDPSASAPQIANFPVGANQAFTGQSQFFSGMDMQIGIVLTLREDGTAQFTVGTTDNEVTVMSLKGTYSFDYYGQEQTFTFDDGGVIHFVSPNSQFGTFDLTPETEFDPTVFNMFSAAQAGTYIGQATVLGQDTTVTLVILANGKCSIQYSVASFGLDVDEEIDFTDLGGGEYKLIYYNDVQTTVVTFNSNGTINLSGGWLDGSTLAKKMFTEEQAGTYTGNGSFMGSLEIPMVLTFDVYGKGTFVWQEENSENIKLTENNGTYSFTYDGYNASFTFDTDGSIILDTENYGTGIKMTAEGESGPTDYNVVKKGNYKYKDEDSGITYWLLVDEDLTSVIYIIDDPDDFGYYNGSLTVSDSGEYSFNYANDWVIAFTVNDNGSLSANDIVDFTLSPTNTEPEIRLAPAYVGEVGGTPIKLVIEGNTIEILTDIGSGFETESTGYFTVANGKFTLTTSLDDTVTFTLNSAGNLEIEHSYYGTGTLTPTAR